MTTESRSEKYYDEFAASYERHRHQGYHLLLDELEVGLARRYCGERVLEAGCGTGLILQRLARQQHQVVGIDLSRGMLARARERGLDVVQGTLDELPFADDSFDSVVSFKVLPHIQPIREALRELARVTRPGGHLLLEFYNSRSLRGVIKRLKRPTTIGATYTDEDVFTRLDTPRQMRTYLPPNLELLDVRGVRVVTPLALVHRIPLVGSVVAATERWAADAPGVKWLGGFLILILQKVA